MDADGNVRPGCRILAKGEIYDIKWFSGRKDVFKNRNFLDDVKVMYTDLINKVVDREEDKLQIFDASGPYLATKKIGKIIRKRKKSAATISSGRNGIRL